MTTTTELTPEDRLAQLVTALGVERAHVVAAWPDYQRLVAAPPPYAASVTIVPPPVFPPAAATAFPSRLPVVTGDAGPAADQTRQAALNGSVEHVILPDLGPYDDTAAAHADRLGSAMVTFFDRQTAQ